MEIFDNRSAERAVEQAFDKCRGDGQVVRLAAPYFTAGDFTQSLLDKGCIVELILELNEATDVSYLERLFGQSGIEIKYFARSNFHSKLYLLGDEFAIVGSANLTNAGFTTNGEICVRLDSKNKKEIKELEKIFEFYWRAAESLDREHIKILEEIKRSHKTRSKSAHQKKIDQRLKQVTLPRGKMPSTPMVKKARERHAFKRQYLEVLEAYEDLRRVYESDARRKLSEKKIPLLIEIDQFLSFLREEYVADSNFQNPRARPGQAREQFIRRRLQEWHDQEWTYLQDDAVPHFRELSKVFRSPRSIRAMNTSKIFDALWLCHAFRSYGIRFGGSKGEFKKLFSKENDLAGLRNTFVHLLHGRGGLIDRLSDCIHDPDYKPYGVGRNTISELVGWLNTEGLPIINGRTLRSLRYLGYSAVPEKL